MPELENTQEGSISLYDSAFQIIYDPEDQGGTQIFELATRFIFDNRETSKQNILIRFRMSQGGLSAGISTEIPEEKYLQILESFKDTDLSGRHFQYSPKYQSQIIIASDENISQGFSHSNLELIQAGYRSIKKYLENAGSPPNLDEFISRFGSFLLTSAPTFIEHVKTS